MPSPLRLLAVLALSTALPATAQPPVIEAGECLYLVGAPAGAPAAETEETTEDARVYDGCTLPHAVEVTSDGPYRIEAWLAETPLVPLAEQACELLGRVSHGFTVAGDGQDRVRAWVRLAGTVRGSMASTRSPGGHQHWARLDVVATELTDDGVVAEVARKAAFIEHTESTETRVFDERFGVRLDFDVRPGATYHVGLDFELEARLHVDLLDFGQSGSDRFVGYEQIEVCLSPRSNSDAASRGQLEQALYRRDCYPEIWLPEERGGRLEEARALVSMRLGQSEESGAPGVHGPAARRELERADQAITDGDYQRACRALSQAVHALTSP